MKHKIKVLIALSFLLSLNACVKFRSPEEEKTPEEVQIKNLEDAVIQGEMFLYTGRILSKEDYHAALAEDVESNEPISDPQDVILEFAYLEIEENSVLYTMGKNLRLTVKTLEADQGARIAAFPEEQTAALGKPGRSGGTLVLSIDEGLGALTISLMGEIGGEGLVGPDPDEKLRGPSGERVPVTMARNGKTGEISCVPAQNGSQGGQGLQGYLGGVGMQGGNSGTAKITVVDDSKFELSVFRKEGTGGRGGQGGRGGEGGPGGDTARCNAGGGNPNSTGAKGIEGPQGKRGPQGPPGQGESWCIDSPKKSYCQD